MPKRWRQPSANPGQLLARWGKLRHSEPDLCYFWGEGSSKADAGLLHDAFCRPRPAVALLDGRTVLRDQPSFLAELEARGYDISTFRFSIEKKPPTEGI